MEKLDKKNILYVGGAIASVAALAWLWAQHSASSAAAQQQAVDQANSGVDPATAAYEAAIGSGASSGYGNSTPVASSGSSDPLATDLPALISALGLGSSTPTTAPTYDYSSQIAALYQADLGRAPETAGTAYYNALLNSGTPLSQVAQYIAASPEAQSYDANQTVTADTGIVTNDYETLLGRAPSASEVSYYNGLLASGTSAAQVTQYFENSPEYLALHSSNTVATSNATSANSTPAAAQAGARGASASSPAPSPVTTSLKLAPK